MPSLLMFLIGLGTGSAQADTFTVQSHGDGPPDLANCSDGSDSGEDPESGSSPESSDPTMWDCLTLRDAVETINMLTASAAVPQDHTIILPAVLGASTETVLTVSGTSEDNNQTGDLDVWMHPGTTLGIGSDDPFLHATIRGQDQFDDRLLDIHSDTHLLLDRIRFLDGDVDGSGGCLRSMNPAAPSVDAHETVFEQCQAGDSGGAAAVNGNILMLFSDVINNQSDSIGPIGSAGSGGGGALWVGGDLELHATALVGNDTLSAGGAARIGGSARLFYFSEIEANAADENGGGLWVGGDLLLEQSVVFGNIARIVIPPGGITPGDPGPYGGGVYVAGQSNANANANTVIEIQRSTISGNSAGTSSALHVGGSAEMDLDIINSTISMNEDWYPFEVAPAVGWYDFVSLPLPRAGSVWVEQSSFVCNRNIEQGSGIISGTGETLSGGIDLEDLDIDLSNACPVSDTLGIGYVGTGALPLPPILTFTSLFEDRLGGPTTSGGFNAIRANAASVTLNSTDATPATATGFGALDPLARVRAKMPLHRIHPTAHPAHDLVPCGSALPIDEDEFPRDAGENNTQCDAGAYEYSPSPSP